MTIKQSTPQQSLEDQILSEFVPKNEREWWACRHIKYLRDEVIAERNSDIKQLRQRVQELEKEIAHWKNNHETEVRRARILKERTDMPIERVQAYEQWGKDQAERDALLEANRIACEDLLERHDRIAELKQQRDELLSDVERCYRMLLSEPDTQGALFKAENILRDAISSVKEKQNAAD